MRKKDDYYISIKEESLHQLAGLIYNKVLRTDFNEPGFVVIDFGVAFTSEKLRACMVQLKEDLSQIHINKSGQQLCYQWMGRFDQQESTKFHIDNAADQSFLMLGYEPTVIKSKLFFADYVQLIQSMNISGDEYFEIFNPMFTDGEKLLSPFITEIKEFNEETYKIILMNNSNTNKTNKTLGVFHKAEIIEKDETKQRVINSVMLYSSNVGEIETYSKESQQNFIYTSEISKR
jgi:hypothetical protein